MKNSRIEWCDHTWNPWVGCRKVSEGCKHCYMFRDLKRFGQNPGIVRRTSDKTFLAPLKWKEPARVFTCSWSDFFIEQADEWREEAWKIIQQTPHLTYLILTKRPENIKERLPKTWGNGWPNVWLGVSVESQKHINRVSWLSTIPAVIRFVSYEPALGEIGLYYWLSGGWINWVISGGESGPNARPANPDWFRRVRDECWICEIPYFHKQNGGNKKINGSWGGRELDGKIWSEIP